MDEFGVNRHRAFVERDQHPEFGLGQFGDLDGDHLPPPGAERRAQPGFKAVEIVAHGDAVGNLIPGGVLEDFDKGHKEVVAAVVELLDKGVGVGAALVAENVEPLMNFVAVEVKLLAEALHDQLLHVARE